MRSLCESRLLNIIADNFVFFFFFGLACFFFFCLAHSKHWVRDGLSWLIFLLIYEYLQFNIASSCCFILDPCDGGFGTIDFAFNLDLSFSLSCSLVKQEDFKCQKCLQKGHFTYQCTGKRKYVERDSRTRLMNKKLKMDEEKSQTRNSVSNTWKFSFLNSHGSEKDFINWS